MINPIANTADFSQATQDSGTNEIRDQFLTMLMAQIQHQDPLNPMETAEFTSQLAQLSTVEQLQSVNRNLGFEQLYLASINNSQALGFIGKEVMASGDTIDWDGETSPGLNYMLNSNASNVVVNVLDNNGTVVRTIHAGEQEEGKQSITWDGAYSSGEPAPAGTYTFKVIASDSDGSQVDAVTMLSGKVDGIAFEDGVTYVTVRGLKIPIGDIIEINSFSSPPVEEEEPGSVVDEVVETVKELGKAAIKVAPFLM